MERVSKYLLQPSKPKGFQVATINGLLSGRDVFVRQSTSSGKSITYQLPALMEKGKMCICICPTISLIDDQFEKLKGKGIDVINFSGKSNLDDYNAVFENDSSNKPSIAFMTPEFLFGVHGNPGCIDRLEAMKQSVSLFALDECHYIWQWGGSFHCNFNLMHNLKDSFPHTPIIALTATATLEMTAEMKTFILRDPIVLKGSVNRPKIFISIEKGKGFSPPKTKVKEHTYLDRKGQNYKELDKAIGKRIKEKKTIIYGSYATDCKELSKALCEEGLPAGYYVGAKMTTAEKRRVQKDFKEKRIQVICVSEAFGVGVDIKDIEVIMQIGCPPNLNLWVQELGRAGHDGHAAEAILWYDEYSD